MKNFLFVVAVCVGVLNCFVGSSAVAQNSKKRHSSVCWGDHFSKDYGTVKQGVVLVLEVTPSCCERVAGAVDSAGGIGWKGGGSGRKIKFTATGTENKSGVHTGKFGGIMLDCEGGKKKGKEQGKVNKEQGKVTKEPWSGEARVCIEKDKNEILIQIAELESKIAELRSKLNQLDKEIKETRKKRNECLDKRRSRIELAKKVLACVGIPGAVAGLSSAIAKQGFKGALKQAVSKAGLTFGLALLNICLIKEQISQFTIDCQKFSSNLKKLRKTRNETAIKLSDLRKKLKKLKEMLEVCG